MKIAPSSEAYCGKHRVVLIKEIVEKGECYCTECEHMIIRKKVTQEKHA